MIKPSTINNSSIWQPTSENYSPDKIAILAPRWLQEALGTLFISENSFVLVANTRNEDIIFSLLLSQSPDIIIIDADRRLNKAMEQIIRIKAKLQSAKCLMLVDQISQISPLTEAGADVIMLKGSPPSNILEAVKQIAEKRQIEIRKKRKPQTDTPSQKAKSET